jgi:sugar/nucleoside kinase (ribokinase family)
VFHNLKLSRELGVEVILNPAPAIPLPGGAYKGLGHLLVNETEASILSGITGIKDLSDWDKVATEFISRGVQNVIITLGGDVRHISFPTSRNTFDFMISRESYIKPLSGLRRASKRSLSRLKK